MRLKKTIDFGTTSIFIVRFTVEIKAYNHYPQFSTFVKHNLFIFVIIQKFVVTQVI